MDTATLVGPDIALGEEVLDALDQAGIKTNVALLGVTSEDGDWRLILSSPSLDQISTRNAIGQVLSAVDGKLTRRLPDLLLLRQKDPFVRELRKRFAKAIGVQGLRLGNQPIGERFLEAGYVFRVR